MKMIRFEDYLEEQFKDPELRRLWEEDEPARQVTKELIKARIEGNISQRELARKAKTTQAVISRIENGSVSPSINTVQRLAQSMGKKLQIKFV